MSSTPLLWEEASRDWAEWSQGLLSHPRCVEALLWQSKPVFLGASSMGPPISCSLAARGAFEQQLFGATVNHFCTCWGTLEPGVFSLGGNGMVAGAAKPMLARS